MVRSHSPFGELKRSFLHKLGEVEAAGGNGRRHARVVAASHICLAMHFIPRSGNVCPARVSCQLEGPHVDNLRLLRCVLVRVGLLTLATATLAALLTIHS